MRTILSVAVLATVACGGEAPKSNEAAAPADAAHGDAAKTEPAADAAATPPADGAAVADAGAAPAARTGEEVYNAVCITCHQAGGAGLPPAFPPLAGSEWPVKAAEIPIKIVLHGLQGEIDVNGTKYNSVMTPNKDLLSDEEIANVLTYVRSNWGNNAEAVTAEQVKAVRDATADRAQPWTVAELGG